MPELPEVETIARGLAGLVGCRIGKVTVGPHEWVRTPPPSAGAHLEGRRIAAVTRHGKRLLFRLEPEGELVVQLGMSGQITVPPRTAPLASHTHLRLELENRPDELRFRDARRFGGAWVRPAGASVEEAVARHGSRGLGDLGPDALTIGRAEFRRLLARDRQIKALLLDQTAVSGIGNIYCDEALFQACVHPLRKAGSLSADRVDALHGALRRILRRAIRAGGSTLRDYVDASGGAGRFQTRHQVYGREGQPCPRCGARIARIPIAGRSTHLCRRCQRAPRRPR
ncbi:MAG TPA: bifunctional DNA-formamidopyrimidine glycosylase/DNA-(apurinic or apyrimidinic site) lyase [bacterium]|nr:bifunctional DNA-formamidopyrimidine glycosylase/DNA-(apurinic or apyrimidinic site) lyase [bacterium]